MATKPVCPCDTTATALLTNLPALSQIAFRAGDFNDFGRALLTPLGSPAEQSLTTWRAGAGANPGDLAVMMVEWWAYLADILTFYNERIANEDYLRTAALPETPAALIRLLGYRPRPAIGSTGTLAALVSPSVLPTQTVTLPAHLQFQSKPGPGLPPQTFELTQATGISLPDQATALPPAVLVATQPSGGYGVLLRGTVTTVSSGMPLLLTTRNDTSTPTVITLTSPPAPQTAAGGSKQTLVTFAESPRDGLRADQARLARANQSSGLWTVNGSAIDGSGNVHLAGLARSIRPGDWLVFTTPGAAPQLAQVTAAQDVLGDAGASGSENKVSSGVAPAAAAIPVLHTQLSLTPQPAISAASAVTVLFNWVDVGTLIDQPPSAWDGVSSDLIAVQPGQLRAGSGGVLLADAAGNGGQATANPGADGSVGFSWPAATTLPLSPTFLPPISIFYNLLAVTCGKTVAKEILGSGDASVAGQSFTLAKSPVTYLSAGAGYASTIAITVNGQPWKEVASFYGQPANAQVFTTREDASQMTHIDFGDGINGARLPTGANNVIATYRFGAGAASPAAGKLTVLAQSYPGLQAIVNPLAVTGGSDPDPAALLKQYAPRSVLTFGRAVSIFDYQAIAAQAPGVSRASAAWAWDAANQRAGVIVYVAGEAGIAASVAKALATAGDPNRPVTVRAAKAVTVTLTVTLVVTPGVDTDAIEASVTAALCDPLSGLFAQSGIGQALFDSQVEAACLAVPGVVAILDSMLTLDGADAAGPLFDPGTGAYLALDPADLHLTTEADPNG